MEFNDNKNIFIQIGEWIMDQIIQGKLIAGERVPSVRELAEEMVVNRNTVNKTFTNLQDQGILENRRGMGYFVAPNADSTIREIRKQIFFNEQLPQLVETAKQLQLSQDDFKPLLEQLKRIDNENE
jgi:GntR family transcriptional regulator